MPNTLDENTNSKSLSDLLTLLSADPDNIFPGGALEEEIAELETELGTTLSLGYIEFLKKFGGGNLKYLQLYSIASEDENFYDFMEQVQNHSQNIQLIQQGELLPFANDYEGNIFCFDLQHSRENEYIIVRWDHDYTAENEPLYIAHSFAEFIEKLEFTDKS